MVCGMLQRLKVLVHRLKRAKNDHSRVRLAVLFDGFEYLGFVFSGVIPDPGQKFQIDGFGATRGHSRPGTPENAGIFDPSFQHIPQALPVGQVEQDNGVGVWDAQGEGAAEVAIHDPFVLGRQFEYLFLPLSGIRLRPVGLPVQTIEVVQGHTGFVRQFLAEGAFPGASGTDQQDFFHGFQVEGHKSSQGG